MALAAGCGGAENDFREEAQAICRDHGEQIEAVGRPADLQDLAETSGEVAGILDEQLAELRELEPPDSLRGDFEEWLRLGDEAVENAREIQDAAGGDDQERINELAGVAIRNGVSADRLARDLGLPDCMIEQDGTGEPSEDAPVVTVGTDGR